MQVYEFQKSLLDRLDECMGVLSWKDHHIPASQVRNEWSYFIELQIEPAGWQALWKIPRNMCEQLKVRYPTVVFGYVENVIFRDLTAVFDITAVQDEGVHLPERHEVALEDLWPTLEQENAELNIERTADCLDRLRFFNTHVWMPWDNDNDDDFNWVEKHLQSRIRLCFDLRQHNMNRPMAAYIRSLINEAKYIQQRRAYLERDLSDDEEEEQDSGTKCDDDDHEATVVEKSRLTQLMRLHLRLTMIRGDIEMLENPEMRHLYEEIKLKYSKPLKKSARKEIDTMPQNFLEKIEPVFYVVALPTTLSNQIDLLHKARRVIPKNKDTFFNHSLQDVLDMCKPSDKIYLSGGSHMINFLEYFSDNGLLYGLESSNNLDDTQNLVRIFSNEDNSNLLIFDGDFTVENIVIDCQNIRTGIIVKYGNVTLRNCKLIGNGKSSIQQGVIGCSTAANIHMDNCTIENFATGITLSNNCSLTLKDSTIINCNVGLEVSEYSKIKFIKTTFQNCKTSGIYHDGLLLKDVDDKFLILKQLQDLKMSTTQDLPWTGDCSFKKCESNIFICNDLKSIVPNKTLDYIHEGF